MAIGVIISPGNRRTTLLNALLGAPFGLTDYWYIPDYWNPARLSDSKVGLEDILFAFAICGVMWLAALLGCRLHGRIHFTGRPNWTRYLLGAWYGLTVVHLLKFFGIGLITGTLVSFYSLGLFILWKKPGFWPLALYGGGSFLVLYGLLLKISTATIPGSSANGTRLLFPIIFSACPLKNWVGLMVSVSPGRYSWPMF